MQDKKHLGTIHTSHSVDQYWHIRTKSDKQTNFHFQLERTTRTGTKVYDISKNEIPKQINLQ
jgi:hypothetical protein